MPHFPFAFFLHFFYRAWSTGVALNFHLLCLTLKLPISILQINLEIFQQQEYNHCSTTGPSGNSWLNQMRKIEALLFVRHIDIKANFFLEMIMLNCLLRVSIHQGKYSNFLTVYYVLTTASAWWNVLVWRKCNCHSLHFFHCAYLSMSMYKCLFDKWYTNSNDVFLFWW